MKKDLLLITLLATYCCDAQNYQCLQAGVKPYYTNGNGYLRSMRVDSVISNGSDTIYYPYHTPRGGYSILDSNGGSWLGKKVIKQANGRFLFDDIWRDTVVINTQASLGDTWIFFEDTTHISYKATITATDTMTILGTVDSIKKITIEADTNRVINPSDPVNNFEIILSRNNGFVQIFDLYTFPYHIPGNIAEGMQGYDYYLDLVQGQLPCICDGPLPANYANTVNSIFHLVSFHNPTQMELNNFSVGEILEFRDEQSYPEADVTKTTLDTILSKTTTVTSVIYTTADHISSSTTSCCPVTTTSANTFDTISGGSADTTRLMDLTILPEEWMSPYFYHYFPNAYYDSGNACPDPVCVIDVNNINYTTRQIIFQYIDPSIGGAYIGNTTYSYSIGFGLSAVSINDYTAASTTPTSYTETARYIFVKNQDSVCGSFLNLPLSVSLANEAKNQIDIFPNPATTFLTISSTNPSLATASATTGTIKSIAIANLLGQALLTQNYNADQVQIDVSTLPTGLYFVKVNGSQVAKFVKE